MIIEVLNFVVFKFIFLSFTFNIGNSVHNIFAYSGRSSPMLSSQAFIFLSIFSYLDQQSIWDWIFWCDEQRFIFFMHRRPNDPVLWKTLFFSFALQGHLKRKSEGHIYVNLFLDTLLFHWSVCLFLISHNL